MTEDEYEEKYCNSNSRIMICPVCKRTYNIIFGDTEICLWGDQRLEEIGEEEQF